LFMTLPDCPPHPHPCPSPCAAYTRPHTLPFPRHLRLPPPTRALPHYYPYTTTPPLQPPPPSAHTYSPLIQTGCWMVPITRSGSHGCRIFARPPPHAFHLCTTAYPHLPVDGARVFPFYPTQRPPTPRHNARLNTQATRRCAQQRRRICFLLYLCFIARSTHHAPPPAPYYLGLLHAQRHNAAAALALPLPSAAPAPPSFLFTPAHACAHVWRCYHFAWQNTRNLALPA